MELRILNWKKKSYLWLLPAVPLVPLDFGGGDPILGGKGGACCGGWERYPEEFLDWLGIGNLL